jgi:hypothetical protein
MKAVIDEIKQKALERASRDARRRISNLFANRDYAESIGFETEVDVDQAILERGLMKIKLPTEILEEHNALASRGLSVRPNQPWRKPVCGMGFSPGRKLTKEEIAKKRTRRRRRRSRP